MWSRSTVVTTAASASTMLTASRRPPSPTSRIATSSLARANSRSAASVPDSKDVIGVGRLARVDAHALVVAAEVRRRVQPDAVAGGAKHRLEQRAGRALAVG